jgi:hypothetical protein
LSASSLWRYCGALGSEKGLATSLALHDIARWSRQWAAVHNQATRWRKSPHRRDCLPCYILQQHVEWFRSHNSRAQPFWTATVILSEGPRHSRTGWMLNDIPLRYPESTSGAPQPFGGGGTEYMNILKSMKSSSECEKMMSLSW